MELFVWLEVMPHQVELKCAIITHGGQCVMMDGVSRMLEWCADNLDYQHHVSISTRLANVLTVLGSVLYVHKISTYVHVHSWKHVGISNHFFFVANSSPGSHRLYVLFYFSPSFQLQLQHQMQDMVRG